MFSRQIGSNTMIAENAKSNISNIRNENEYLRMQNQFLLEKLNVNLFQIPYRKRKPQKLLIIRVKIPMETIL